MPTSISLKHAKSKSIHNSSWGTHGQTKVHCKRKSQTIIKVSRIAMTTVIEIQPTVSYWYIDIVKIQYDRKSVRLICFWLAFNYQPTKTNWKAQKSGAQSQGTLSCLCVLHLQAWVGGTCQVESIWMPGPQIFQQNIALSKYDQLFTSPVSDFNVADHCK